MLGETYWQPVSLLALQAAALLLPGATARASCVQGCDTSVMRHPQTCQRAAWAAHHAVECAVLEPLAAAAPSDADAMELLLACRALRTASQPPRQASASALVPCFGDCVGTLWQSDVEAQSAAPDAWAAAFLADGAAGAALLPPGASASAAASLLRAGRRNDFAIMDDILTPLAAASYPFGARLNHGCDANCTLAYEHAQQHAASAAPLGAHAARAWLQRVRAVRHIAPGEARHPCCAGFVVLQPFSCQA